VLDLLAHGISASETRGFLEDEYNIWVADDAWSAFLRRHISGYETVAQLQDGAVAMSKASKEAMRTRLFVALTEAYARGTRDGQAQGAQYAELCRAVRALLREVVWWRCVALALAVFVGGLGVTVVSWLLRG
jgi:hypothetical protein